MRHPAHSTKHAAKALACGLGIVFLASQALAQAEPPRSKPGDPVETPPEKIEPKPVPSSPVPEAPPGSLSDRLDKRNGVIPPPKGVDPEMHKAPPEGGKIRIIPPPVNGGRTPSKGGD